MERTLKQIREENKKTVAEVAKALGIAPSSYYNYEQGTRQINIHQVLILSILFEESTEEIIKAQISSLISRSENRR